VTSETTRGQAEIRPTEGTQGEIQRRGPENVELGRENQFAILYLQVKLVLDGTTSLRYMRILISMLVRLRSDLELDLAGELSSDM
jgi:hypothetical protein